MYDFLDKRESLSGELDSNTFTDQAKVLGPKDYIDLISDDEKELDGDDNSKNISEIYSNDDFAKTQRQASVCFDLTTDGYFESSIQINQASSVTSQASRIHSDFFETSSGTNAKVEGERIRSIFGKTCAQLTEKSRTSVTHAPPFSIARERLSEALTLSSLLESEFFNHESLEQKVGREHVDKSSTDISVSRTSSTEIHLVDHSRNPNTEKEALRQRKQEDKLARAKQKAIEAEQRKALRTANKCSTDKRVIVTEMVVEISLDILQLPCGNEILDALQSMGVQIYSKKYDVPHIITWKRTITKIYDNEMKAFVPSETVYLFEEPFVLRFMDVEAFVSLITDKLLEKEVSHMAKKFSGRRIILLINGLPEYYRSKRMLVKKSFEQCIRNGSLANVSVNSTPISQSVIESQILMLNDAYKCHTMEISKNESLADWLVSYTREIAVRPYEKNKQMNSLTDGLGPTGKDMSDTWSKMLQSLFSVTETTAKAITDSYPTISSLINAYEEMPRVAPTLLSDISVVRSESGQSRRIGEALSRRIHHTLTFNDPLSRVR